MSEHETSDLLSFVQSGIALCRKEDWQRGLMYLRRVAELHPGMDKLPALFYSYLGYGVMRFDGKKEEGLALCRHAARKQFYQPEIQLNLARAQLLADNRPAAVKAVQVGLALDADHPGLRELREELGVRQPVALPSLGRGHLINRILGRLRKAYMRRRMMGLRGSRSAAKIETSSAEA